MVSDRPHPEHTACPLWISRRQVGQWYPKGLLLPQVGQSLESLSMSVPQ